MSEKDKTPYFPEFPLPKSSDGSGVDDSSQTEERDALDFNQIRFPASFPSKPPFEPHLDLSQFNHAPFHSATGESAHVSPSILSSSTPSYSPGLRNKMPSSLSNIFDAENTAKDIISNSSRFSSPNIINFVPSPVPKLVETTHSPPEEDDPDPVTPTSDPTFMGKQIASASTDSFDSTNYPLSPQSQPTQGKLKGDKSGADSHDKRPGFSNNYTVQSTDSILHPHGALGFEGLGRRPSMFIDSNTSILGNDRRKLRYFSISQCCGDLCSSSILGAKIFRFVIYAILVMSPGVLSHFLFPNWTLADKHILYWSSIMSFIVLGYYGVLLALQFILYICHKNEEFFTKHSYSFIYHLSECKSYVALFIYVCILAILWNLAGLGYISEWEMYRKQVNKVIFAVALGIVVFAYKNHLVRSMAMSFNYTNYIDRISDCLFADKILHLLARAKGIYRIKRRDWLRSLPQAPTALENYFSSQAPGPQQSTLQSSFGSAFKRLAVGSASSDKKLQSQSQLGRSSFSSNKVDGTKNLGGPPSQTRPQTSAIDIPNQRQSPQQSSVKVARDLEAGNMPDSSSNVNATIPPTQEQHTEEKQTTAIVLDTLPAASSTQSSFNPFNVQQDLTAFYKFAQRLMTQFETTNVTYDMADQPMHSRSATSGSNEGQSEVHREAKLIARRLFKWLLPPDAALSRVHLTRADFEAVITNPSDLNRFWNMLYINAPSGTSSGGFVPSKSQKAAGGVKSGAVLIETPKSDQQTLDSFFHVPSSQASYQRFSSQSATIMPSNLLRQQQKAGSEEEGVFPHHLTDFIDRTYKEVMGLSQSLHSMEAAVKKLDVFFSILCLSILMIFLALLFGDFLAALTSISGLVFSATFMFGSSAKHVFESIIFLFVSHPFDVGDRVYISLNAATAGPPFPYGFPNSGSILTNASPGSGALENLVVSEMHLITTIFERWDGAKVYVPNYVLATKPIINIRRSGALFEVHRLQISFTTSTEKLNLFKKRVMAFLKKESMDYSESLLMNVEFFENCNRMHILLQVQHRTNWQDLESQLSRKSKLLMFLRDSLESLQISYYPPVQKVELLNHSITSNTLTHS